MSCARQPLRHPHAVAEAHERCTAADPNTHCRSGMRARILDSRRFSQVPARWRLLPVHIQDPRRPGRPRFHAVFLCESPSCGCGCGCWAPPTAKRWAPVEAAVTSSRVLAAGPISNGKFFRCGRSPPRNSSCEKPASADSSACPVRPDRLEIRLPTPSCSPGERGTRVRSKMPRPGYIDAPFFDLTDGPMRIDRARA